MTPHEGSPSALLVAPLQAKPDGEEGVGASVLASRRLQFLAGLLLLGIVVFLWVFSSILTQFLYDDPSVNYPKPVAMTTLSTATASFFLLPQLLRSGGCLRPVDSREGPGAERVDRLTLALISLNWFCCQWTFNVSLGHTALATNTLLSSTSVVWSYLFTVMLGFRRCSFLGPVCILLGMSGISLAVFGHEERVDPNAPVDDAFGMSLALGSALMYGSFSNLLALRVKPSQMAAVWGIVGVSSAVIGAVLTLLGHLTSLEPFEAPSSKALGIMLLNGFLGTSISDYIWAQGVLLTAPLVANITLNMTIPVSMVVDAVVLRQHRFSWTSPAGGTLVFLGVVVAAVDEVRSGGTSIHAGGSPAAEMRELCRGGAEGTSFQQM